MDTTAKTPRRRIHKPTLSRVLREARKAGATVRGATIEPDGRIALQFGEPDSTGMNGNEWDQAVRGDKN
jgi:hypothetical protein